MEPLNMCMFASRVDYDAAVRKHWEGMGEQPLSNFEISQNNLRKALTNINKTSTMRTSLKQGAK